MKQPRAENDATLEISNVEAPRRSEVAEYYCLCFIHLFQGNADEHSQEGAYSLPEDVEEEDMAANEVEDVHDVDAEERPAAVVVAKAVRRLSFSSGGGGNEPKKLKTSGGTGKEQGKMQKKKPVSKTKKAGLVFPVSRVHNRLKKDRYATRVRILKCRPLFCQLVTGESECRSLPCCHPGVPRRGGLRAGWQLCQVIE